MDKKSPFRRTRIFGRDDRVRVSGGHICEAKAPTEPAGETSNLRRFLSFL